MTRSPGAIATAARDRLWRGYADVRRRLLRHGSADRALTALRAPKRADVEEWTATLARRHDDYRGAIEPVAAPVTVVCVSARPQLLGSVARNVAGQTHRDLELVFVANDTGFDAVDIDAGLAVVADGDRRVTVLRRAPEVSLGACLNAALDSAASRFVAKFDDDDLYGPEYLRDAMRAHAHAGAGVVGKHTYYAYIESVDRTILRFPAHEFRYSSTLAGGTLVLDRDRIGDLRFPDVSLGEDRAFIAACHRRGVSTYSADRFNFVQVRGADNTWAISERSFAERSLDIGAGLRSGEAYR